MSEPELLADVAHQVRTPLAVIRGYAELLSIRDDEATRLEAAGQIGEAAAVLDVMVDDLLVLFALESGVLPFAPEPLDLAELVDDAVARVSSRFAGHSFVPRVEGVAQVHADREHVDRILRTLLLNACRLSPDGGEIALDARDEGDAVVVSVSDNGAELSTQDLDAVFERDHVSAALQRSEVRSTGLELYKVRRLVELHGGTVNAESRGGHGSTFSFSLPR